jgi:predicted PurR-regulated permease PerM
MVPMSALGPLDAHERVLRVYLRTVLSLTATLLAVFVLLYLLWVTRQIIVWLLIAIFLAVALDPLVAWFQRHGLPRRGLAVVAALLVVLAAIVAMALAILPPLVRQVDDLVGATPDYVDDLTSGRGPLGFLQRDYQIVDRVQERIEAGGSGALVTDLAGGAVQVAATVVSTVVAIVTILVMVVFLLLGGPRWVEQFKEALSVEQRDRFERVGGDLYRSVGGYVRGNLAISVCAGVSTALVLLALDVPYALALALIVALFDLVPLVGATIGAAIVFLVALVDSTTAALIWLAFAIVYQQLENHLLQPVVYGRAVRLPAIAVLLAVLVGAKLAGVVGALGAIPAASAIQIIGSDMLRQRRLRAGSRPDPL